MVRFKNRWLLVELIPVGTQPQSTAAPTHHLEGKHIWAAVRQSVLANFGDVGWGAVGLSLNVKYYSPTTNICIIRVARDHHRIAWGAVTLLSAIEGVRYIPNVVHVSGTIKHAQLAAIAHNREVIARYRALAKTPAAYQDSYETYLEKSTLEIEALQD
ncbi:putative component of ribonuclease P, a protein complex that generates mature tRNA molecules by cleaving their 5'-ends [Lyophyllum shimeji]|uniref:Component of ribonuclease P, a protein complex that generates mature tRNA molecules by cleaving their 5'-ends n=1 Tax=Lyophyllum shimeji TaxID=47721 RepID=A0A9P3Q063_LYOSH|nr:putative component of ribonuclease P, a protein complex that generates mature tRNA molecules by cleaving their 5'-ends [Lyophyllum shimeji]